MAEARRVQVKSLCDRLIGRTTPDPDWDVLIRLANESLTITTLAVKSEASSAREPLPADVRRLFETMARRNRERNVRLMAQFAAAARALNASGIVPAAIKGVAVLLSYRNEHAGTRILTDLDLVVDPDDRRAAVDALLDAGYEILVFDEGGQWPGEPEERLPTVLAHPEGVGTIDLHTRLKGPRALANPRWLFDRCAPVEVDGARVLLPSPLARAVCLVLHDQLQEGDYFRGLLDVRHLLDLARLLQDVDVRCMRELMPGDFEKTALDTQILTARALFTHPGTEERPALRPRLQLARRLLQLDHAWLRVPLTMLTLLSELQSFRSWDRFGGRHCGAWREEVARKSRELLRLFRPRPLGKL